MTSADEPARNRARSLLPRFGLRSLFVVALLFCLVFGWIGRNLVQMRQEDAALEALLQADARVVLESDARYGDGDGRSTPKSLPSALRPQSPDELIASAMGVTWRPSIERVVIEGRASDDPKIPPALAALAIFPEISSVKLQGPAFKDAAMAPLIRLPRLKRLSLSHTDVSEAGLASLARETGLEVLDIWDRVPTETLVKGIPSLVNLRLLQLDGPPLTRADVAGIATLPKLEELRLFGVQPAQGEEIYVGLNGATNLKILRSTNYDFSNAELATIAALPNLEALLIDIDDAGLAQLGTLPKLKRFVIWRTATADGARAFSAANPGCLVAWRPLASGQLYFRAGEAGAP